MADQQEMPLFPTYEIHTVADFAKVPRDRIRACLDEFAQALEIQADTETVFNMLAVEKVGPAAKGSVRVVMDRFEWTDDNAGNISLTLELPETDDTLSERVPNSEANG